VSIRNDADAKARKNEEEIRQHVSFESANG